MNRTGKRRLLKLADLLEKDAKNKKGIRFDLSTVFNATAVEEGKAITPDYVPEVSCGTTACAMGLAAISGEFKRAGLSFQSEVSAHWAQPYLSMNMEWNGDVVSYIYAAVKLFHISNTAASFLFDPEYYKTKSGREAVVKGSKGELQVAKRIRNFVKGKYTENEIYCGTWK